MNEKALKQAVKEPQPENKKAQASKVVIPHKIYVCVFR